MFEQGGCLGLISGFIYIYIYNCIYLFVFVCAGSSLLCGLFSSLASGGSSLAGVHEWLIAVASLVEEHRLQAHGLQ